MSWGRRKWGNWEFGLLIRGHMTQREKRAWLFASLPQPRRKPKGGRITIQKNICVNSTVKCYTKNNGNRFRLWYIVKFPVQRTQGKLIKKRSRVFPLQSSHNNLTYYFFVAPVAGTRFFPVLARYGRKNSTNSEVCGMTVGYSCIFISWIGVFTSQWLPTAKKCEI